MYFPEDENILEYEEVLIFDQGIAPVSPTNTNVNCAPDAAAFFKSQYVCIFCSQNFLHKVDLKDHINKIMECEHCGKWFCDRNVFTEHVQSHLRKRPGKFCAKNKSANQSSKRVLSQEELLFEHIPLEGSENPLTRCIEENKPSRRRDTVLISALEKCVYECDYCKRFYRCKKRLTVHILAHMHGKEFQCNYCGRTYMYESSLDDHVRLHTGEGLLKCDECGKIYESRGKLAKHVKLHTLERNFKCDVCGKKFHIKNTLSQHQRTHDPSRIRSEHCDICGNDYTSEYFPVHRRMHTGEKPYRCELCDKSFVQPSGLWEHKAVHDVEKKFKCPCGKRFSRKKDLKKHVVQHTGKGFVYCAFCDKAFSSNWLLVNHERKHTGERPFVCKICGDSFSQKTNLATHLRIHTGERRFACEYCGRRFSLKVKLLQHLRIHTGEKPFECEFCRKRFTQLATLRAHLLVHSKETTFECDCCGEEFRRKSFLSRHISQKHVLECYY